jgi:outer membrane protein assembly factor BamB
MNPNKAILFSMLFIFLINPMISQDISQWRGPNRDGIYNETGLLKTWPEQGPEMLWSTNDIGKGYSSASIAGKAIYITGMKDSSDYLTKLDMSGKIIWQKKYGGSWYKTFPDTRGTPTIEKGKIYLISGNGNLVRMNAKDGKIEWEFNAFDKFEGAYGEWGICESLLLTDDKLIYTPGGHVTTMVALNKETGKTIWTSEAIPDTTGYVSPILIERGGKKIIVTVLAKYIIGVDAENGKILWKHYYYDIDSKYSKEVWARSPEINTNSPIYHDGQLYVTSGYNHTGVMFKLSEDGLNAKQIWTDSLLDVHHGGAVLVDGYLYGANWINNRKGNWCCIDWKTGEQKYEHEWYNKGSVISADGYLYVYEERAGNLALVKADPEKFEIAGSFKVPEGTGPYWSHLVIHKGVLYVRHGDTLMAYKIK